LADIPDSLVWPEGLISSRPAAGGAVAVAARQEPATLSAGLGRQIEQALTILVLFMMSDALIGPLVDPNQMGAGDDNPWLRAMWLPVYGLTVCLAAVRWRAMLKAWLPLILVALLMGLAWASSTWSIAPEVTGRRVMALVFTSLFGIYLGARWSWRDFVTLIAVLAFLLAVGSYAVCIGYPIMGIHHGVNAGDWRGLWFEKNAMGAVMAIGVLASVASAWVWPTQRWRWTLNAILCLGLVVMSRSGTALITIGLIVGATTVISLMRRGPVLGVITVFGVGAVAFGAAAAQTLAPDIFLTLLGKDATLTGRTEIWAAILRQASAHPWLGFGYAAFWEKTSVPAAFVRAETGWKVPSAHNGWLDMLVQLGAVGVALCALLLVVAYILALIRALENRDGNWALIYLSIFLITAFSESVLMQRNSLPWTLCIATLTKLLSEGRLKAQVEAPLGNDRGWDERGRYGAPAYDLWPRDPLAGL
jgi:O-antigen ligase